MAKGGHKCRVKVEEGRVITHAPLNDETAIEEGWPIVDVPIAIPGNGLNELISASALTYDEEQGLTWLEDWQAKVTEHQTPGPSRLDLLEARIEALEAVGK